MSEDEVENIRDEASKGRCGRVGPQSVVEVEARRFMVKDVRGVKAIGGQAIGVCRGKEGKKCTGEQTLVGSGEMREEDMGAMRRVRLSRTEHGGRGKSGVALARNRCPRTRAQK